MPNFPSGVRFGSEPSPAGTALFQMIFKDQLEQRQANRARQGLIESQQMPETPQPADYEKPYPALAAAGIGTSPMTTYTAPPMAGTQQEEPQVLPSITNLLQQKPVAPDVQAARPVGGISEAMPATTAYTGAPPAPEPSGMEKFPLIGKMFKKTQEPQRTTDVPMPDYVPPEREYNEQVAQGIPKGQPTEFYTKSALYGAQPTEQRMLGELLKEGIATGDMSDYLALKQQVGKPKLQMTTDEQGNRKVVNLGDIYSRGGDVGMRAPVNYAEKNVLLRADDPKNPNPGRDGIYTVKVDPRSPQGGFTSIVAEVRDPIESAKIRAQSYMQSRFQVVYDAYNNYAPRLRNAEQINAQPDRWLPAVATQRVLDKTALLQDMMGTIANIRQSLAKIPEFDAATATQVNEMLRHASDKNWFGAAIQNAVGQTLTPEQADYVVHLAQLRENSLAVRSILNAGPGSDQLRDAILATLPTAGTPNKAYAMKQIDAYEQTLGRLSRGLPDISLVESNNILRGMGIVPPAGASYAAPPPAPAGRVAPPAATGVPGAPTPKLAF